MILRLLYRHKSETFCLHICSHQFKSCVFLLIQIQKKTGKVKCRCTFPNEVITIIPLQITSYFMLASKSHESSHITSLSTIMIFGNEYELKYILKDKARYIKIVETIELTLACRKRNTGTKYFPGSNWKEVNLNKRINRNTFFYISVWLIYFFNKIKCDSH